VKKHGKHANNRHARNPGILYKLHRVVLNLRQTQHAHGIRRKLFVKSTKKPTTAPVLKGIQYLTKAKKSQASDANADIRTLKDAP
jgi:hypothetical protein